MSRSLAALLALGLAAAPAVAQEAPRTIALTEPDATFPEPFSALLGLRELGDGRVLISDRIQQTVALLDFASGSYDEVGRPGGGPGEYQMPGSMPGPRSLCHRNVPSSR